MFEISKRKNLWDIKYITYITGMYFSVKTNEELSYYSAPQGYMKINFQGKPNTEYTLSLLVDADVGEARILVEGVVYDLPNGKHVKSFTTDQLGYETIVIYGGPYMKATNGRFTEIQIEEGSVATDYESPNKISEIVFDTELFGFNNVCDALDDGKLYKYWNREIKTTDSSGNFTLSDYLSGTKAIVINNTNGEVKILDAGSTISTGWTNTEVTVIYVSSAAEIIENPQTNLRILSGINNFEVNNVQKDIFIGDGSTTTFNLSKTADNLYYSVYVNGKCINDGITKTTTSFSFDTAPKNGALIEVFYNVSQAPAVLGVEVYEPTGSETLIDFITNLSIQVEENSREVRNIFNEINSVKLPETYRVRLSRNMLENVERFYNQYKDKVFRLKILNTSTNEIEYLSPCKIVRANRDYFGRIENIDIIALDYYK